MARFNIMVAVTEKGARGTSREIKGIGDSSEKAGRQVARFSGSINKSIDTSRLARRAFGLLAGYLGLQLARSFIAAGSEAEQYGVRLRVLLGSQEEANKLFQDLTGYASQVPFEYREIMESATALAGILEGGSEQIRAWLPLIGDLAAATGLSIQETTGQVMRMLSAGAASADLFRERGVLAMLGFQAGVSYSAEETRKKLVEAWRDGSSRFRGATEELAETWQGATSMMADAWFNFRRQVMEAGLSEELGELVNLFTEAANDPAVQQFAVDAGRALTWVVGIVIKAAGSWKILQASIYDFTADSLETLSSWQQTITRFFIEVLEGVESTARVIRSLAGGSAIGSAAGATNILAGLERRRLEEGLAKDTDTIKLMVEALRLASEEAIDAAAGLDGVGRAASSAGPDFSLLDRSISGVNKGLEKQLTLAQRLERRWPGLLDEISIMDLVEFDQAGIEREVSELEAVAKVRRLWADFNKWYVDQAASREDAATGFIVDEIEKRLKAENDAAKEATKKVQEEYRHQAALMQDLALQMVSVWGVAFEAIVDDSIDTSEAMEQVFRQMLVAVGQAIGSIYGGAFGAAAGGILGGLLGGAVFGGGSQWTGSISSIGVGNQQTTRGATFDAGTISGTDFGGMFQDLTAAIAEFERIVAGTLDFLPQLAIEVNEKGDRFKVTVAGEIVGVFDTMEQALGRGLQKALRGGLFDGVADEVITAIANNNANSLEQLFADLALAQHVADLRQGAGALTEQLRALWTSFQATTDRARELGLSTSGLTDEFLGSLEEIRDRILGLTKDEFVQRLDDADEFNREIQRRTAIATSALSELLLVLLRYENINETLGRGQRILEAAGFKTIEALRDAIAALQQEIGGLEDLLIPPGSVQRRGGDGGVQERARRRDEVRRETGGFGLSDLDRRWQEVETFTDRYMESIRLLGFSEEELAGIRQRVHDEQLRQAHEMGSDVLGRLGLTSEDLRARYEGIGSAIEFVASRLDELGISAERWQSATAELGNQMFAAFARGLLQYVDDAEARRQIEVIEHQLWMAEKRLELEMIRQLGLLTAEQLAVVESLLDQAASWTPAANDNAPGEAPGVAPIVPIGSGRSFGSGADARESALRALRELEGSTLGSLASSLQDLGERVGGIVAAMGWSAPVVKAFGSAVNDVIGRYLEPTRRYLAGLDTSPSSPLRPIDQYDDALDLVQEVFARIQRGDLDAIEDLQEAIQTALDVGQEVVAGAAYRDLFAEMKRILAESIEIVERQGQTLAEQYAAEGVALARQQLAASHEQTGILRSIDTRLQDAAQSTLKVDVVKMPELKLVVPTSGLKVGEAA